MEHEDFAKHSVAPPSGIDAKKLAEEWAVGKITGIPRAPHPFWQIINNHFYVIIFAIIMIVLILGHK